MSERNKEDHSLIFMAVALVAAVAAFVIKIAFALFVIAAFAITILALAAWNKPLALGRGDNLTI